MTEVITVADAKRRFSELIDRVRHGERFLVTRRGTPVMALLPPDSDSTELPQERPAGVLALVGLVEDWDHESFVEGIYAARRRARDRRAPDLGPD